MLIAYVLAIGALAVASAASPFNVAYAVHEKRNALPLGWSRKAAISKRTTLSMRVALSQSNLERGWEWLKEVSHPESKKFGQHWTAKEVAHAFAPSNETVEAVQAWLKSTGIAGHRIEQSAGLNWLNFDATVEEAENLLQTKYHIYEHGDSGQSHVACEEYSIPATLQKHIDFVYPTVHFDAKVITPRDFRKTRSRRNGRTVADSIGQPGSGSLPKLGKLIPQSSIIKELVQCDQQITPDCLRYLYSLPTGSSANSKNSYGIVEYTPQAYVPSDLDLFFSNFSPSQVGQRPKLDSIDGGYPQQTLMSFNYNGESDLDLEYSMTLIYPQNITLYQVGDLVEGGSFNNFLDAIDGSYCTYEGGDDPTQDAIYPDTAPGGYSGAEACGEYGPTRVISTSYTYNEHDLTPFYENRQCNEYLKLGMMGVSVLYSSGDYGVAGNSNECINGTGADAPYEDGDYGGRFNPSFPGTCPWITTVGATQVKNNTNILASPTEPEQACETVIYSGGGFSNVFALPEYQQSAVHDWFTYHPPPYGADKFNNSQRTRGLPDVAANGANYVTAIDGSFGLVYGTSASSPTFGSVLTFINEARYNSGKSSIGFINPVAYAHPSVFNDVTTGNNPGCATTGFEATTGWDPVTGLGTPNYPKMLSLWLGLP